MLSKIFHKAKFAVTTEASLSHGNIKESLAARALGLLDMHTQSSDLAGSKRILQSLSAQAATNPAALYAALVDAIRVHVRSAKAGPSAAALQLFLAAGRTCDRLEALVCVIQGARASANPHAAQAVATQLSQFLLAHVVDPAMVVDPRAGNYTEALSWQPALKALHTLGVSLPERASRLVHWRMTSQAAQMYETLLANATWPRESQRALRWIAGMAGPEQAAYATIRTSQKGAFTPYPLHTRKSGASSMQAAFEAMLPAQATREILTVTLGKPWGGVDDIYMSFHGRTHGGFGYSARMLFESYEAALLSAWGADQQTIGAMTKHLVFNHGVACAEGKAAIALEFLESCAFAESPVQEIQRLWAAVRAGKATHSEVMTEHVRVFFEASWRAYAVQQYGKAPVFLSEALSRELSGSRLFVLQFFNADALVKSLRVQKAEIGKLSPSVLKALVDEQVDVLCTIERP